MQESFWWWQCSDRYIISLSPTSIPPTPPPPPISLMVCVDVKHHVLLHCRAGDVQAGLQGVQDGVLPVQGGGDPVLAVRPDGVPVHGGGAGGEAASRGPQQAAPGQPLPQVPGWQALPLLLLTATARPTPHLLTTTVLLDTYWWLTAPTPHLLTTTVLLDTY